ncbi:SPOC domain-containing protein [Triangularia verruculosa]|uniref:Transcription factor BYE1 n=1 Tax=Triangularia verruculosa TaxID=2587418 RepID=A0AAN6XFZ4_9PEZI|nr:SPOC domain-containing protein [Triangularia verruculosa]
MSDPEPRRSVRATKGQHKAHEQLDQLVEPPKKRTGGSKKGKKAAPEPEEPEEEIIRCVCGATEQDEDSGEPWIACDTCTAWQHNICMGISRFAEDIPKNYWCEQCKPENHKELLAALERGEKLWETRRKNEEEKSKKKKGTKKGKKRTSDLKEEESRTPQQSPPPPPPPPAPEPKKEKEPKVSGQKRKTVDGAQEKETKLRKVTETQSVPVSTPAYTPPADIPSKATELPDSRQGVAKALIKSLVHSLGAADKKGLVPSDGVSVNDRAEKFALQVERAVYDTHPTQDSYRNQGRTLVHNLKSNLELGSRLLEGTLTPPMLAAMSTEELASKELQDQTAEMKARAEKQAIKITEDVPRIRRTHKGDEIIGDDGFAMTSEDTPSGPVRRPSAPRSEPRESSEASRARSASRGLAVDTQQSPSRADFDLNKVYSSVKSPAVSQRPAPPLPAAPSAGPGVDPDVDRMLGEDGSQSPPYSPREETDPDVVWRGNLVMNTIAEFQVTAKHIGGGNPGESVGISWDKVIPKNITVCGRIDEQAANVYLCGMRYSQVSDVIVVNLEPTSPQGKADMQKLVDYFVTKKRYGVVDRKGVANVRDSYLVPVLPGQGGHPEFMMNLEDNFIPQNRTGPMMLAVFVYRWEDGKAQQPKAQQVVTQPAMRQEYAHSPDTPTPTAAGFPPATRQSISAPAYSPTVNSGPFPNYPTPPRNSTTPLQQQQAAAVPAPQPQEMTLTPEQARLEEAQRRGTAEAREVLGPYIRSPTVAFLLPQAHAMTRSEWELIRRVYEREPKAREDLPYLSQVLEKEAPGPQNQPSGPSPPPPPTLQQPQQQRPQQYQAPLQQHQQQHFQPPPQQHQPPYSHPHQVQQQHAPPPSQHQHQHQHQHQQPGAQRSPTQQHHPQIQQQQHAVPVRQTAVPPPQIPPPVTQAGGPPRQTPIPPPPIPPQATATTAGPQT